MHALLDLTFRARTQFSYVPRCLPLGFRFEFIRASTRKQVKSWEGKNIGVSFGYETVQAATTRGRGEAREDVAMARVLRVICNSQVGRAEERCEIPGRFSGEEQARRTKRTRRCLSGLFANDVPMSRVTLTRRHLEPAAMNFSIPTFFPATRSTRDTRV